MGGVVLRDVTDDDLATFYNQQLDPDANYIAAFTAEDPADRAAFMAQKGCASVFEDTP